MGAGWAQDGRKTGAYTPLVRRPHSVGWAICAHPTTHGRDSPVNRTAPHIVGQDYSVYQPLKVEQGLKLWTEAYLRALPALGLPPIDPQECSAMMLEQR
jgi:hypothetical protein